LTKLKQIILICRIESDAAVFLSNRKFCFLSVKKAVQRGNLSPIRKVLRLLAVFLTWKKGRTIFRMESSTLLRGVPQWSTSSFLNVSLSYHEMIFLSPCGQIGFPIVFGNNLSTNPPNPEFFTGALESRLSKIFKLENVFFLISFRLFRFRHIVYYIRFPFNNFVSTGKHELLLPILRGDSLLRLSFSLSILTYFGLPFSLSFLIYFSFPFL